MFLARSTDCGYIKAVQGYEISSLDLHGQWDTPGAARANIEHPLVLYTTCGVVGTVVICMGHVQTPHSLVVTDQNMSELDET